MYTSRHLQPRGKWPRAAATTLCGGLASVAADVTWLLLLLFLLLLLLPLLQRRNDQPPMPARTARVRTARGAAQCRQRPGNRLPPELPLDAAGCFACCCRYCLPSDGLAIGAAGKRTLYILFKWNASN